MRQIANSPAKLQAGSSAETARLSAMMHDHSRYVAYNLRRLGVRSGDADDLSQRVFLIALRSLPLIREGAERAYLRAVAIREASHARRSYRRRAEIFDETAFEPCAGSTEPDELALRKQALTRVRAVLQLMDEDLRRVFELCVVEELASQQVARLLDLPLGTVKSRLRRAWAQIEERSAWDR